jgi:hypothetical protein
MLVRDAMDDIVDELDEDEITEESISCICSFGT